MKELTVLVFLGLGLGSCQNGKKEIDTILNSSQEKNYSIYLKSATQKFVEHDYKSVIADCNSVLQLNSSVVAAYSLRGYAEFWLNDFGSAIKDFDKVIEINGNDPEAYNGRGLVKQAMEDYKGALLDYDKSIGLDSVNCSAFTNRADVKTQLGDFQGALLDCNQAIAIDSTGPAFNIRGTAKSNLKDYLGAIKDFTFAISISPKEYVYYYNRAVNYHYLGKSTAACSDWRKAGELGDMNAFEAIKKYCN